MIENEKKSMSERTVGLVDMDRSQASERFAAEVGQKGGDAVLSLNDAVINFTPVDDFTTFKGEYAWSDGDLIIHFFLTKEMVRKNKTNEGGPRIKRYWLDKFPRVLDIALKEFFQADSPRLTAKYTPELASWYVRAQGYDDRLDLDLFAEKFFEHLDQVLELQKTTADLF